jgi:hypothetical protein
VLSRLLRQWACAVGRLGMKCVLGRHDTCRMWHLGLALRTGNKDARLAADGSHVLSSCALAALCCEQAQHVEMRGGPHMPFTKVGWRRVPNALSTRSESKWHAIGGLPIQRCLSLGRSWGSSWLFTAITGVSPGVIVRWLNVLKHTTYRR